MSPADLLHLFGQFGVNGLFVGYLIWRDIRSEKMAQCRIETDKLIASSLASLTTIITSRGHV